MDTSWRSGSAVPFLTFYRMAPALGRRLLEGKHGGGHLEILKSLGHVATSCLFSMVFKTAPTETAVVEVTL